MSRSDGADGGDAARTQAAERLAARGWVVIEGGYSQATLARISDALDELHARFDRPALYSKTPHWLAPNVEVAGPGLAFYGLLGFVPELAPSLFRTPAVATMRQVLGEDMHLELVGAVLSDETRPFTEWETHLGGIDDERWRKTGRRPQRAATERIVHFLFLEPMTRETGSWRVLPRQLGDSSEPAADIHTLDWPGSHTLSCNAGDVLLLDESTWHSVLPRRVAGVRRFVGAYFAAACAESTVGVDASLSEVEGGDALFRSLVAHD